MARKKRLTAEERIRIVQDVLEGKTSQSAASRKNGINCSTINEWVRTYKVEGTQGLTDHKKNRSYSAELKTAAVKAYLSGEGSLSEVCSKYRIREKVILRQWIKVYNSGYSVSGSRCIIAAKTSSECMEGAA